MKRSAQRKLKIINNNRKSRIFGILLRLVIPSIIVLGFIIFMILNTKYWNGRDKLSFVFQNPNGTTDVIVLDPALNEETTLKIPGDTQVDLSRNYGTLKLKSVWQLGLNEKLGGRLLTETITKNFYFPLNLWSSANLDDMWKFVFSPGMTNIDFGDRLSIGLFVMRVKNIDKTEIDLAKSQFLHKQALVDGTIGYVTGGQISNRLTVYFTDNTFGDKNLRFSLVDMSGLYGLNDNIGQILEVMGGKVVAVDKKPVDSNLDCQIYGQNSNAVQKVSTIFNCQVVNSKTDFDLEIKFGKKFADRF